MVFWRIFDIFLVVKIITKKMKNIVIYSSMSIIAHTNRNKARSIDE